MKSSHRHNLKKKLKRGESLGKLVGSVIQNPDATTREEIFGLFWQTYEKGATKFEKLNRKFFEEVAKFDGAHWVMLRHEKDNRLAAFMLCFQLGRRAINKFIGLDGTLEGDWYLYFRLWREAVEWASNSGATELQSGQTGYRAKLDLDHELVPLTNYCRNANPTMHWVYAKVAAGITWESLDHDLKNFLESRRAQKKEEC
jgi:predicted N-acyltransferase